MGLKRFRWARPGASARAGLSVALLCPAYWPEVRRGTERFVHELGSGLAADGHRPRVVTSHPGPLQRGHDGAVPVLRLPRPPSRALDRRHFEDNLTHAPLSATALTLTRPDVAHALHPVDGVVAGAWSRVSGRPSVLSYMGYPEPTWIEAARLRRRAVRRAAATCDAVVTLSHAAADQFASGLGIEARVIHPGVDLEAFSPGGERSEEPTVFCAASILAPAKRVHELVAAFALVRREHPRARLLLSRPADVAAAERLLVGAAGVEMVDVDDHHALEAAYRNAWITALPSVGEAFGLVLVESLACATPAVGRRSGAIPEVLGEDTGAGVLYEGGAARLAAALLEGIELAEDPATAAACRARAERFSQLHTTRAYENLYAELIAARKELV